VHLEIFSFYTEFIENHKNPFKMPRKENMNKKMKLFIIFLDCRLLLYLLLLLLRKINNSLHKFYSNHWSIKNSLYA
jgi:hypothetical protein